MIRHCKIPMEGRHCRAICLKCGSLVQYSGKMACTHCLVGFIILVEDDNTIAGVTRVDIEIDRLYSSKEARDELRASSFPGSMILEG